MVINEPEGSPGSPDPLGGPVSDRSLIRRFRGGQPDAATAPYLRYAERLQALATSQSSPELARRVDPEDIVQSVFRTFFRRASLGHYSVPDGEEIWKLLLVIALNKVRAAGAFHRAAKRDVRRTAGGEAFDRALDSGHGGDEAALNTLRMVIEDLLRGPERGPPEDDRAADRGVRGGRDRRGRSAVEAVGGAGPPGFPASGSTR